MSNQTNSVLYIGVTNDLYRRTYEHKDGRNKRSFTFRYNCKKLVYYEEFDDIELAIKREKQLKKWNRAYKDRLIDEMNMQRADLFEKFIVS